MEIIYKIKKFLFTNSITIINILFFNLKKMDGAETAFSCKICYSVYDDYEKKPYIISPCSHTICIDCLREILEINSNCPFCKKEIKASINEMKPNYELIDIINTIRNSNNDTRCVKCSDVIDAIYFKEKNNNIQFLCKKCAKDDKNNEDDSNCKKIYLSN